MPPGLRLRMTCICIDTNLFLGLYGADEDPGEILADIWALRERLVFPDIIFDEFFRNRSKILDRFAEDLRRREIAEVLLPSVIQNNLNVATLQRAGEDYNRVLWTLYEDIQKVITDPAADPMRGRSAASRATLPCGSSAGPGLVAQALPQVLGARQRAEHRYHRRRGHLGDAPCKRKGTSFCYLDRTPLPYRLPHRGVPGEDRRRACDHRSCF